MHVFVQIEQKANVTITSEFQVNGKKRVDVNCMLVYKICPCNFNKNVCLFLDFMNPLK